MKFKCFSDSVKTTQAIGQTIGRYAPIPSIFTLQGDLGAGKTALTKGIAKGLDITATVNSPTFNICKIYHGRSKLVHIDAYRLTPSIDDLGFEEEMDDALTVIEWSENTDMHLSNPVNITIDYDTESTRMLTFEFDDATITYYDCLIKELRQWSH